MTWSYSRITSFEDCPYRFLLNYILHKDKKKQFFSEYGGFVHELIAKYLTDEFDKDELSYYYLKNFQNVVPKNAPNFKVYSNYFNQGLEYLDSLNLPDNKTIAVEKRTDFEIEGKKFVGIIDLIQQDSGLIICDHKSRALKPRSKGKRYLKTDEELDKYLRQLYLYSIPVKEIYGEYPKQLRFNCFRTQTVITEPFSVKDFEKTKVWAVKMISKIEENDNWKPNAELFKCKYICDHCLNCEYYKMIGGAK